MPKATNYTKFFSVYCKAEIQGELHGEIVIDCPLDYHKDHPELDGVEHLYCNVDTGQWHCKHCEAGGNARNLITELHQQYLPQTTTKQYKSLERIRHIDKDIFLAAQWAYDEEADRWLVPYFTWDPETGQYSEYLNNLGYFHPSAADPKSRYAIHKAPALPLYLYLPGPGLCPHPEAHGTAYLQEGEWDNLAYYQVSPDTFNLGKPGSGFPIAMTKTIKHCHTINLMLDNDPSGVKQTSTVVNSIQQYTTGKRIFFLDWSLIEYAKKDIRDLLPNHADTMVKDISLAMVPAAESHLSEVEPSESEDGGAGDEAETLTPGYVKDASIFPRITSFQAYLENVRSMHYINDETVKAMAAVLAITASITVPGEPLWAFLIGPASSGKTSLIESFGGTNQWFDNLSKIKAESLVSGWKDDSGEESSYLPGLKDKTLFVKDLTTTLTGSKEDIIKIFGLLTDIFDGHVKIHHGNNKTNEFHSLYFNMIAGVTDIVNTHSAASLGERFLRIDWLGHNYDRREYTKRALMNFGQRNDNKIRYTTWTLGFSRYLREQTINYEYIEPQYFDPLTDLAELVATIRTKVEKDRYEGMIYRPRPELGTRLAAQFAKLFVSARTVLNSHERAFDVVRKVALDTCSGFALDLTRCILENPFISREALAEKTGIHAQRCYRVLQDMLTTGIIKETNKHAGIRTRPGRPTMVFHINQALLPALQPEKHIRHELYENRSANNGRRPSVPTSRTRPRRPSVPRGRN